MQERLKLLTTFCSHKRVQFVDHDIPQRGQHSAKSVPSPHEHGFKRLGRDEQAAIRFLEKARLQGLIDVTVPGGDGNIQRLGQFGQTAHLVIDERLERADVENNPEFFSILSQLRKNWEKCGFSLSL